MRLDTSEVGEHYTLAFAWNAVSETVNVRIGEGVLGAVEVKVTIVVQWEGAPLRPEHVMSVNVTRSIFGNATPDQANSRSRCNDRKSKVDLTGWACGPFAQVLRLRNCSSLWCIGEVVCDLFAGVVRDVAL